MHLTSSGVVAAAVASALLLTACGDSGEEAACGTVTAADGSTVSVHVASGPATCAEATQLLRDYYAAPPEQLQGNAAFWNSPTGWTCFSPTAGSAEDQGFGSACDQPRSGARVEAR